MNMQIEHDENGGSEQPSCSNVGLTTLAIRKIVREEFESMVFNTVRSLMKPMVIATLQQEIKPLFEELFRSVAKEEIQKHLTGGTRNDLPKEMSLQLKFLDEVCGPVQTGIDLKGKKDECLKLALYDENEDIVTCGHESSAKVEIVLLSDNGNDDGNMTLENFERRIIRTGDKEKPHFAKSVYINLEKGVGSLTDLKLGHGEKWTKLWNCRLGAKMAENLPRTIVQEAWTEPFKVIDKRAKLYEKHYPPFPIDEVWRLEGIGRGGGPCNRLKEKNIETVKDFLFWLSVNFERLQKEILGAGKKDWNTIITHAKECIIDVKRMYYHESSTGPLMGVIYNAVGELKGVIDESHFVPVANLSADKKDYAKKLLMSVLEPSAFLQRYKTSFDDEDALVEKYPSRSSDSTNASSNYLNGSENIHGHPPTGPDLSSQSMVPELEIHDVTRPSGSLGSRDTCEQRDTSLFPEAGDTPTAPDVGLCFENPCFPTRLQSENHELITGTVGGSSRILPDTSLFSASSTMNLFGENGAAHEDFGSSRSATDHMEIKCGSDPRHNGGSPGFSTDLEEFMERFPSTSSSVDTDFLLSENVDEYETMGPCLSPQSIIPDHHDWSGSPNLIESWMIVSNGDEENAADEPQIVDRRTNPPKRWKKLVCVRRRVSLDVSHNQKKKRVG